MNISSNHQDFLKGKKKKSESSLLPQQYSQCLSLVSCPQPSSPEEHIPSVVESWPAHNLQAEEPCTVSERGPVWVQALLLSEVIHFPWVSFLCYKMRHWAKNHFLPMDLCTDTQEETRAPTPAAAGSPPHGTPPSCSSGNAQGLAEVGFKPLREHYLFCLAMEVYRRKR